MRARPLGIRALYAALLLLGLWAQWHIALVAFGGRDKLMLFEVNDIHRNTSMAMLEGDLKLYRSLALLYHDLQVFNGTLFTCWGFGVPLLQLPFHALARKMHATFASGFFPDRAIFFSYLALAIPAIWAASDRVAKWCAPGLSPLRRSLLSWSAALLALTCGLYPIMANRFVLYEVTICYFVLFEFLALSAYVLCQRSWHPLAVSALAVAASLGLLIRASGLLYFLMWAGLVLLEQPKERSRKTVAVFSACAAPFIGFWLYSNWVKTGSPIGLGYMNCVPIPPERTPVLRFGSPCLDSVQHVREAAARLFDALVVTNAGEVTPWMKACDFWLEEKHVVPGTPPTHEPALGMVVFVLVGWMLMHLVVLRERRLAIYAPFAVLVGLFGCYVWGGYFAWRFNGDFWPAIVLAFVQYTRALPPVVRRFPAMPLAFACIAGSYATFQQGVVASLPTLETLSPANAATMMQNYRDVRGRRDKPDASPSHLDCGKFVRAPESNGYGWAPDCRVDVFTNVFLGVTPKTGDDHELRFTTEGMNDATLRVYVNGRFYTARREGDSYRTTVTIPFRRLESPSVLATIQWTKGVVAPSGKLRAIELD